MGTRRIVPVGDIGGPTVALCWKENPRNMARCTIQAGHKCPHLWQLSETINALRKQIGELELAAVKRALTPPVL